jgi:hypothetical protein
MNGMSRVARALVPLAFALACCCRPLALDACALTCEAALAAQGPVAAAPCHHPRSCARQISQPGPTAAAAQAQTPAPPPAVAAAHVVIAAWPLLAPHPLVSFTSSGPPAPVPLRV